MRGNSLTCFDSYSDVKYSNLVSGRRKSLITALPRLAPRCKKFINKTTKIIKPNM